MTEEKPISRKPKKRMENQGVAGIKDVSAKNALDQKPTEGSATLKPSPVKKINDRHAQPETNGQGLTEEQTRSKKSEKDDETATPTGTKPASKFVDAKSKKGYLISLAAGVAAGLLLGFIVWGWSNPTRQNSAALDGAQVGSSTIQMKSDLSTTLLKQQEMEARYEAVSEQLEIANQYIFLLRMKERISAARYQVDQKQGFEARQTLSELQDLYTHLKPFVIVKDSTSAEKLETTLKFSIKNLVSDPEAIKSDLEEIKTQLDKIETKLFSAEN